MASTSVRDDQYFLKLAIEEGKKGTAPHLYGAVIVKDSEVLAIDHNHVWEKADPSAHAEISAIIDACKKLGSHNLPDGCIMYGSHEPCLMCFSCAVWANVSEIVYANPANDDTGDSYEFEGLKLSDVANKLHRRIAVRLVRIDGKG